MDHVEIFRLLGHRGGLDDWSGARDGYGREWWF